MRKLDDKLFETYWCILASESTDLPRDVIAGLQSIVGVFASQKITYALIGGVATSFRSRPRTTRDLDFIVQVSQLALPGLLEELEEQGFEFDLPTVVRQFVQEHMTALKYRGIKVDWLKPMLPIYQHVVDRAQPEQLLGVTVRVAAPESLILTKLLASRGQDQIDIENLLASNRGKLDLDFVRHEWNTVADFDDPRFVKFEDMLVRYYQPPPAP
jgi:Nucleotidyl transferase of unknown function (DUF2204)